MFLSLVTLKKLSIVTIVTYCCFADTTKIDQIRNFGCFWKESQSHFIFYHITYDNSLDFFIWSEAMSIWKKIPYFKPFVQNVKKKKKRK